MRANWRDSSYVSSGSALGIAAQINLEVHEAVIFFDGQDFWHVKMSGIEKLELTSQVEIKKPLHSAVRRDDASLHNRILQSLLHFCPMLVMPGLRSSGGKRKLFSGFRRIPRAWVHDHIGRFFGRKR